MKIIQHIESFEIVSGDRTVSKKFYFDDKRQPPGDIRVGKATKKRAFQDARTFAGKGHTVEKPE